MQSFATSRTSALEPREAREKRDKGWDTDVPVIQHTRSSQATCGIGNKAPEVQSVRETHTELKIDVDSSEAARLQPKQAIKHVDESMLCGFRYLGVKIPS